MNVLGTMNVSGLARIADLSSFSYCTLALGIDSKLIGRPAAAATRPSRRTGMAMRPTLMPQERMAVTSLSADRRLRVSRMPVSIPSGRA